MSSTLILRKNIAGAWNACPYPVLLLSRCLDIEGANERCVKLALARRDEIVGRYFFDVFPPSASDPTSVEIVRASFTRVFEQGAPDKVEAIRYDVRDQTGMFVERYWNLSSYPLLDRLTGLVNFFLLIALDVTHQVKLEQTIREGIPVLRGAPAQTSGSLVCRYCRRRRFAGGPDPEETASLEQTASHCALRLDGVSAREKQFMELVVKGVPSKIIAYTLGISIRTVEAHRMSILRKTSAKNFLELSHHFQQAAPHQAIAGDE